MMIMSHGSKDIFGGNIMNNNCLCHIFDDNCTWIIILAIILVFCCCCNN